VFTLITIHPKKNLIFNIIFLPFSILFTYELLFAETSSGEKFFLLFILGMCFLVMNYMIIYNIFESVFYKKIINFYINYNQIVINEIYINYITKKETTSKLIILRKELIEIKTRKTSISVNDISLNFIMKNDKVISFVETVSTEEYDMLMNKLQENGYYFFFKYFQDAIENKYK